MDFYKLLKLSIQKDSKAVNSMDNILDWVNRKKDNTKVSIKKISINDSSSWIYDEAKGVIRNNSNSFFQIYGIQKLIDNKVEFEQPIIIQNEIGFLGLIGKNINNTLHFLLQAKIEPGNVNVVQISPTIQATKSNFTLKHGGLKPKYLEYFINANSHEIVVDQLQSEQGSRFYKKRNRNIIIMIDDEIELDENYMWVTINQIKSLLKIDNLVNMDTRSVISCIPFYRALLDSRDYVISYEKNARENDIKKVFHLFNDKKMFNNHEIKLVPLSRLKSWTFQDNQLISQANSSFNIIFCEIEIEGREVRKWSQPLLESKGKSTYGLFTKIENGLRKFLVKLTFEIGCFDLVELGPSIEIDNCKIELENNVLINLYNLNMKKSSNILYDVLLSEEGGRFYHEENRYVILDIDGHDIDSKLEEYMWLDYITMNYLVQYNNILNMQLRSLLSLLEV